MTTTAQAQPKTATRPRRRWHRAVVPFAVVALLWVITGVAHAYEEPDLDEPGTLSPLGTGRHGSSELAEMLSGRGVNIVRVTSSTEALNAASGRDTTIFVPAPDFMHPAFFMATAELSGAHRVVVVRPGLRTMLFTGLPFAPTSSRWATAAVAPGCRFAERAGTAATFRSTYTTLDEQATLRCYGGSLVGAWQGDTQSIVVGATDPFRNDRIQENGNSALAALLLGEHDRLIWVDVHKREPIDVRLPRAPEFELPDYSRDDLDRVGTGLPTIDAFPHALWAALGLGLVAAALLALARARRLGPPVSEPLPVLVPASESVTGRGRLYARIHAREATHAALRQAAIRRVATVLNPFGVARVRESDLATPGPAADALVAQIATLLDRPADHVRAVLYGPVPDSDEALARAVAELDQLVHAVLHVHAARSPGGAS